jgi:hypothetical protein
MVNNFSSFSHLRCVKIFIKYKKANEWYDRINSWIKNYEKTV